MRRGERFGRVFEMVRKELLQIARDARLWRLVVVAPLVQLVVFGYAVSTDVRQTPTFVVDLDSGRASRELVRSFTASGLFRVVGRSDRPADLVDALDHGRAVVGLEIPRGFARDLAQGRARVQVLFDGTDSNTATVAMGYAERILQSYGAALLPARRAPPIDLRPRAWYNPGLESRNYNVPAVAGVIIMLVCLLLTSLAVVRERELGTLEQLMVSPLTPRELILGKTLPFALIGLLDLSLVVTVAVLWFRVPFEGSPLMLLGASLLYLLCGLGMGLLISTLANTQQEAFMVTFLVFMPSMLLSGFFFPVSSMPATFRVLTLINPVRHYLEIVRGIFLKGASLDALWPQCLALALLGTALLALAASRFRKVVA